MHRPQSSYVDMLTIVNMSTRLIKKIFDFPPFGLFEKVKWRGWWLASVQTPNPSGQARLTLAKPDEVNPDVGGQELKSFSAHSSTVSRPLPKDLVDTVPVGCVEYSKQRESSGLRQRARGGAVTSRRLSLDTYSRLCKDPYSMGIFDKTVDGQLAIAETDDNNKSVLVEKSFADHTGTQISCGHVFIQCLDTRCDENDLMRFRGLLQNIVNSRSKGDYMEVEPILIAPSFSNHVVMFVTQYNEIQKRKHIRLLPHGV